MDVTSIKQISSDATSNCVCVSMPASRRRSGHNKCTEQSCPAQLEQKGAWGYPLPGTFMVISFFAAERSVQNARQFQSG